MKNFIISILSVLMFAGCMSEEPETNGSALWGHWITNKVQSEWGEATLELTFFENGHLIYVARFQNAKAITTEGRYEWSKNLLTSEVFAKGNPVYARLDRNRLTIKIEQEPAIEFTRKL